MPPFSSKAYMVALFELCSPSTRLLFSSNSLTHCTLKLRHVIPKCFMHWLTSLGKVKELETFGNCLPATNIRTSPGSCSEPNFKFCTLCDLTQSSRAPHICTWAYINTHNGEHARTNSRPSYECSKVKLMTLEPCTQACLLKDGHAL